MWTASNFVRMKICTKISVHWQNSTEAFFVKLQRAGLNFCHFTSFLVKAIYVKWKKVSAYFFCQIIMGSPLNSNVPERRSMWVFFFSGPLLPNAMSSHCIVEYKGQIIITGGTGSKDQAYTVLLFRLNYTEEIRYISMLYRTF